MPDNVSRKSKFCLPNPSTGDYEIHHFETEVDQIEDMSSYMKGISKTINNANSLRTEIGAASVNDISNSNFHLLRQNSKAYAVGDVAFTASLPSNLVLKCTTTGTTAASEPDFSGAAINETVADGTAVWTYMPLGTLSREITPAFNRRDIVITSGTYVMPVAGWYKITIKGGGGGGAGSGTNASSVIMTGGGGGEGGTTIIYRRVYGTGVNASVVIGAGGSGGSAVYNSSNATDGGNSSVTISTGTYTANGGKAAQGWLGGAGGTGTINGAPGTHGMQSAPSMNNMGGVGGGQGGGGTGAANGVQGGGGMGAIYGSQGAAAGSKGGAGFVTFEYFDPTTL